MSQSSPQVGSIKWLADRFGQNYKEVLATLGQATAPSSPSTIGDDQESFRIDWESFSIDWYKTDTIVKSDARRNKAMEDAARISGSGSIRSRR